ncbi:thiamine pyrophosphate-dependent enzyme, possible carboligase or decarboxylase [Acidovorax sp. CF316]|uniref:benzoylformate decarboxylase n=1 Tax=Acidovorax sp. CF316 TaxID=1144317 RepID=UPI00026BDB80|nr:benzoylformate decarboxylase [Acidovorax sp. CF316]EJE51670.1 thiamine pyrophosphate-dependent enzyme, possible carboligase or decarboxylase [Acidovorax sp. CF316]
MLQATAPRATDAPSATHPRPTVREVVLDLLRGFGIDTIFGNPGSTELPLFLDFPKDFRYVLGLQEAVVVGMADGYAQATHNAAFVNLHSAAGVGHAMGNIFTAHKNRTPMLITAGQQARSILPFDPFLFSGQATELPKPYVKWSVEPARAEDVPLAIARAYYIAMQQPRGPVLVSIPADDWDKPCEPLQARSVSTETRPEPRVLGAIGDALDAAERPVFVVGAAVDRDGAWDDVLSLAERHNAAVWIAPMSGRCGFPQDHRLFAGVLPAMREKIVALLGGHDLVFALGAAAFTYHVEGHGPHVPPGAQLVQLIEDPGTAAWTPEGTSAVGGVRLGVQDLLARPAPRKRPAPPLRAVRPRAEPSALMGVPYVMQTLAEVRDAHSIVVEEAPSSRAAMHAHLPILHSETFYTMCSGGLGYAMPAAVGVALARPESKVIGLLGDGSAMYSIQALWSAAQLQLPITFIILKNRRYAALQEFAPTFGFGPEDKLEGTELPDLDFLALARGQGCDAVHVDDAAQLHQVLRDALAHPRPILVEIDVA